jgi:hypothetical protein
LGGEGEKISLNFGYTKDGFAEKVYHVHLRLVGDDDGLYFRDYLNERTDRDQGARQYPHDLELLEGESREMSAVIDLGRAR